MYSILTELAEYRPSDAESALIAQGIYGAAIKFVSDLEGGSIIFIRGMMVYMTATTATRLLVVAGTAEKEFLVPSPDDIVSFVKGALDE